MSGADVESRSVELRAGERVRFKGVAEIAETLDAEGRTDRLPFMREMLALAGARDHGRVPCGQDVRHHQPRRAAAGHDRHRAPRGRPVRRSVHGGCQAYCLLYVKEQWLERVPEGDSGRHRTVDDLDATAPISSRPARHLRRPRHRAITAARPPKLLEATAPLDGNWRHYLSDVTTRNVPLAQVLEGIVLAAVNGYQEFSSSTCPGAAVPRRPSSAGHARTVRDGQFPVSEPLGLQPGDLVEVRADEIRATLDDDQMQPRPVVRRGDGGPVREAGTGPLSAWSD